MDSFALQFDHAFFCIFAPLIFNWELIDSLYDVLNLLSQSQCKPLRYLTDGSGDTGKCTGQVAPEQAEIVTLKNKSLWNSLLSKDTK